MMADVETEAEMQQQITVCLERLQYVENILTDSTFFNGDGFALVDAAYAPLLIRLDFIHEKIGFLDWSRLPKLSQWKENLLALESVQHSIIEDFEGHYTNKIRAQNGYLGSSPVTPPVTRPSSQCPPAWQPNTRGIDPTARLRSCS